jgi:FkbM family methyltransferase
LAQAVSGSVGRSADGEAASFTSAQMWGRNAVVWIEPVPEQFTALQANIRDLPRQTAIHALVTDTDGEYRTLHVSNNNGESSSIFTLHLHKNIWPEVV